MSENTRNFFKSTLLIAVFSLLSRVLGLLRSTLLGAFYGASGSQGLNDCYTAAFKLPDIIFNLIASGSISIILIPYFTGLLKNDEKEDLNKACSSFLNFFFLLISCFIIIGFFLAPYFVRNILVVGWTNEENILLTIKLTRILLLQTLFMTLSGIFGSYLNALERYKAYSIAMLSYNVGIIIGILLFTPFLGIDGAIWGVVLGGLLHFLIQGIGAKKNGFKYYFKLPEFTKELKDLFVVAIPRIIALSGDQIVRFFLVNFASFIFVGSMFIFDNVENLGMVAYGMIAVSVSTTAFPIFIKYYNANEFDNLLNSLFDKLRGLLFLILPATIFIILLRREIIDILLGYGKFRGENIDLTSDALFYYMIGIPFFSITIVVVKFYYAQRKSLIPMVIALTSVAVTIISSYFLSKIYAISGLSMGRSIGFILQAILLLVFILIINKKEIMLIKFNKKPIFDSIKIFLVSFCVLTIGEIIHNNFRFFQNAKIGAISNIKVIGDITAKFETLLNIIIVGGIILLIYIVILFILKNPEVNYIYKKLFKKK